jgi:hypothetical protein
LYYLFDTIGIYHCNIYKILAYYINHIGITRVFLLSYIQAIENNKTTSKQKAPAPLHLRGNKCIKGW